MRCDRRLPPAGGVRRPERESLLSGGTVSRSDISSPLSRSKAWCGVIGAAPQATACATTTGSARISSQPRRSSTSGGLRCSRRSRLSRRQNVRSRWLRTHTASASSPRARQPRTTSCANSPSATTYGAPPVLLRTEPVRPSREMS